MAPVVGITTQIIRKAKWYKYVRELGFEAVEINRRNSKLHFNLYFLEKVGRYLEGLDLSVHSGTAGIFQPYGSFTRANLATLNAEIDVCRVLGARHLVFHLNDGILPREDKTRLQQVTSYAADVGVEMLYESNSTLVAEEAFDVLESFPELGYVLDLGHLNNGYGQGKLGCEIDDFLRQVNHRVVYVHAGNNSGQRDEHNGLEAGTLDWRHVLDQLDLSRILKIIIEVRSMEMVEPSRADLMQYLLMRNCGRVLLPESCSYSQSHRGNAVPPAPLVRALSRRRVTTPNLGGCLPAQDKVRNDGIR
jgi:sugar phosphate isomerase/epimerase